MDINPILLAARRYEKVRKLNPQQFAELWQRNINGEGSFDDLVDRLHPDEKDIQRR